MNNDALLLMLGSMLAVTAATGYFFWLVLATPPKPEPDSYSENDEEPR